MDKGKTRKGNIAVFLLLIVAFVGMLLLVQSGSLSKFGIEKLDLNYKSSSTSSGTSTKSGGGKATTTPAKGGSGGQVKSSSTISPKSIPDGFKLEQLSPHFGKIKLSSISRGSTRSDSKITISGSKIGVDEAINITGWLIKGKKSSQYIPKAVNDYLPTGTAAESDIIFKKGEFVYIYSSESAIGINFRLNRCIGYLQNTTKFTPSLPNKCPRIDLSEAANFSDQCYDYVRSIGTCKLPKGNVQLPQSDYGCRPFLDKINYKGCYDEHRADADFLSKEWRVWTGYKFLVAQVDQIELYDKNGLLVDLRKY